MAKKIFPGNWVTNLSSYQGQPVVAIPGRVYYHKVGYVKVGSTGANEFDVIIPSPDMRGDDKVRDDITGLTVPSGATIYSLGLRVSDTRKTKDAGTATSSLVVANNNRLKLASAVNTSSNGVIGATSAGTPTGSLDSGASGTTIAPGAEKMSAAGTKTTSALTLKVFVTDNAATPAAGSNITSTASGGTYLICEVSYYLDDEVATIEDTRVPYTVET